MEGCCGGGGYPYGMKYGGIGTEEVDTEGVGIGGVDTEGADIEGIETRVQVVLVLIMS